MKIKCLFLLLLLLFIFGCQDENLPYKEIKNPYTLKKLLILGKVSDFKAKVIEGVVNRLRYSYSIFIDDIEKIDKYNFAVYDRVLLIESKKAGKYETVERYLATYGGVNNMVLFGTVGGGEDKPNIKIDAITSASASENVKSKVNELVVKIRKF